jgi:predicted amidohydrolase
VSELNVTAAGTLPKTHRNGQPFRIALVQSESAVGTETFDPRPGNLTRAMKAIHDAVSAGAEMVVFGEMYLSGYRTDEWLYKWATKVDPPDNDVQALMDVAKSLGICIIMGAATFGAFMPGDVYNSAIIVGPDGLIGTYSKSHVAAFAYSEGTVTERCFYSPGHELPVFDTHLGRIGVHICYDITFPEVARVQALKGAELLINVSASVGSFEEWWDHMLYVRATENASWYVICSVVGEQRGTHLFGGSRVMDPRGKVIAGGTVDQEDIVLADIDVEYARQTRASTHCLNTRKPELYAPLAERMPSA